jgi:hypothetical protein
MDVTGFPPGSEVLMRIIEEFKRMKSIEFWRQVIYWTIPKWPGLPRRRKLTESVQKEDWLPILTSVAIGIIFLIILLFIAGKI